MLQDHVDHAQSAAAEALFNEASKGGCLLADGRFIKVITSRSGNELPRNCEIRITSRFGEAFRNHITHHTTGAYVQDVMVRFRSVGSVSTEVIQEYGDYLCELRQPPGQPYHRFAIPIDAIVQPAGDQEDERIIDFEEGDVFTVKCNGYVDHPALGSMPYLVVIVYPQGMEGFMTAWQDHNEENLAPVFSPFLESPAVDEDDEGMYGHGNPGATGNQPDLGGPSTQPPAMGARPVISMRDPDSGRLMAHPLNSNDPGLTPPLREIVDSASNRWLSTSELNLLVEFFHPLEGVEWPTHAAHMPEAGQIYIFQRGVCGNRFKEDSHTWNMPNGGTSNGKLKLNRDQFVRVLYFHSAQASAPISRRCYWLMDDNLKSIILVHYLPRKATTPIPKPLKASKPAQQVGTGSVRQVGASVLSDSSSAEDKDNDSDFIVETGLEEDDDEDHNFNASEFEPETLPDIAPPVIVVAPGQPPVPAGNATIATDSQIGAATGLVNIQNGMEKSEVRNQQQVELQHGINQLAVDMDLSDHLQKMDVTEPELEPSIGGQQQAPVPRVHHEHAGASGSRPQGRVVQNSGMGPPAAAPPSSLDSKKRKAETNTETIKSGLDDFYEAYRGLHEENGELKKQVSALERELEATQEKIKSRESEANARVDAVKKAKDDENQANIKKERDQHTAEQDRLKKQLADLNENLVQRNADFAALKEKYKGKKEELCNAKEEARSAKKSKYEAQKSAKELAARILQGDSESQGGADGNPNNDAEVESSSSGL